MEVLHLYLVFGGSVTVTLQDEEDFKFELISCQLMCRKESAGLIEATALPFLMKALRIIEDKHLDISCGIDGEITCEFGDKGLKPLLFVTGDLAFQAAVLGREYMSPHHCMHCQMKCSHFENLNHEDGVAWTMPSYCVAGDIASKELAGKRQRGSKKPDLKGMKKRPWWGFIPLTRWAVPLLHCFPTHEDCAQYKEFITAAVKGHVNLGCSVTPKVHLMWKHTLYQMENVPRGLGNKGEDWVERQHQDEARIRRRVCRMPSLQLRAITRSKISQATSHPKVLEQIAKVEAQSKKRKHSEKRESKLKRAKTERGARRVETLQGYGDNFKWTLSRQQNYQ